MHRCNVVVVVVVDHFKMSLSTPLVNLLKRYIASRQGTRPETLSVSCYISLLSLFFYFICCNYLSNRTISDCSGILLMYVTIKCLAHLQPESNMWSFSVVLMVSTKNLSLVGNIFISIVYLWLWSRSSGVCQSNDPFQSRCNHRCKKKNHNDDVIDCDNEDATLFNRSVRSIKLYLWQSGYFQCRLSKNKTSPTPIVFSRVNLRADKLICFYPGILSTRGRKEIGLPPPPPPCLKDGQVHRESQKQMMEVEQKLARRK